MGFLVSRTSFFFILDFPALSFLLFLRIFSSHVFSAPSRANLTFLYSPTSYFITLATVAIIWDADLLSSAFKTVEETAY